MKYEIKIHAYRDGTDFYMSYPIDAKNITEATQRATDQANKDVQDLNFAEVIDVELLDE